jgi:hypothetical protein
VARIMIPKRSSGLKAIYSMLVAKNLDIYVQKKNTAILNLLSNSNGVKRNSHQGKMKKGMPVFYTSQIITKGIRYGPVHLNFKYRKVIAVISG